MQPITLRDYNDIYDAYFSTPTTDWDLSTYGENREFMKALIMLLVSGVLVDNSITVDMKETTVKHLCGEYDLEYSMDLAKLLNAFQSCQSSGQIVSLIQHLHKVAGIKITKEAAQTIVSDMVAINLSLQQQLTLDLISQLGLSVPGGNSEIDAPAPRTLQGRQVAALNLAGYAPGEVVIAPQL